MRRSTAFEEMPTFAIALTSVCRPVVRQCGPILGKQLCKADSSAGTASSSYCGSRRAIRDHHDGGQNQTYDFDRHVADRVACVAVDVERGKQVTQRVRGRDEYQKAYSRDDALPENEDAQRLRLRLSTSAKPFLASTAP